MSGPFLFIIFLNDLDVKIGTEPAIIKCADDCTIVAPVMKGHDFSPDLIRQFIGWTETNYMNCNSSKCKELVFRKKGHTDVYSTISGIPQCTELKIVGLTFQPNCRFDIHVKSKLVKANKCLYVIRTLRKEGCTQVEVEHLFKALVLPNITYTLYADDTSISLAAANVSDLENKINRELINLNRWLKANKLSLNIAKTEFMIIGSRQRIQTNCCNHQFNIQLESKNIENVDHTKSLGIFIDKNLSWKKHITETSKKIASATIDVNTLLSTSLLSATILLCNPCPN